MQNAVVQLPNEKSFIAKLLDHTSRHMFWLMVLLLLFLKKVAEF
jgi:hypothetical protein